MGLAFLAEPAEARADGGGLEGRLRQREQGLAAGGGGCGGAGGDVRVRKGWQQRERGSRHFGVVPGLTSGERWR